MLRSTDSWGYGVILISRDLILHLVPLLLGRWGNCPKFCQKLDGALTWQVVITHNHNGSTHENRKIFFQRRDNHATFC